MGKLQTEPRHEHDQFLIMEKSCHEMKTRQV